MLRDFIEGELESDRREQVREHALRCEECLHWIGAVLAISLGEPDPCRFTRFRTESRSEIASVLCNSMSCDIDCSCTFTVS